MNLFTMQHMAALSLLSLIFLCLLAIGYRLGRRHRKRDEAMRETWGLQREALNDARRMYTLEYGHEFENRELNHGGKRPRSPS
jgi:cbb3-type cytochrome oxidase subunit 3